MQLLNRRQLERLKEKWWSGNPNAKKCEKQDDQSDGISIQNIGGVFIVIFVGIGLACITLAFEYYWYKYRKNSNVINVQEARKKSTEHNFENAIDTHFKKSNKGLANNENQPFKGMKIYPRSRF